MSILNTLFVGKVAHYFPELASTNDFAVDLIAKTTPIEGTVISTSYQSMGKGQIGSNWYSSPDKNLLLSIVLLPKWLEIQNQFSLAQTIALAVTDVIASLTKLTAQVKWPNDVYINDKKVAGILIQNSVIGNKISWSVVGIGLNINEDNFPDGLPNAVALKTLAGREFELQKIQDQLCYYIEKRYLQLKNQPAVIASNYLQKLYQYQSWKRYQDAKTSQVFIGQIIGINKNGQLAVQKEEALGVVSYFDIKEIVFL